MATYNKFFSFVENISEKVYNFQTDQLKIALSNVAPVQTNTVLANIIEISYTNLSSRNITTSSSSQSSGTYKLVCADLTLTASGGSVAAFQYIVLYDDTATNKELIAWYDYGSALTLNSGDTLLIDFSQTNGVLQIT
jgi:hypothetical protein